MTDLSELRTAITTANEVAIRARSAFDRAEEDKSQSEAELEKLGLDMSEPLEPQLDRLRTAAETATAQVQEKQAAVEEAMS
jgi:hypothetical protein